MSRIRNTGVRSKKSEVRKQQLIVGLCALGLVCLLAACTNKDKIPADVLGREEMEKVMWDMIQADRFSSMFLERDSVAHKNIKTENLKLYERVFEIHKITKDEFVRSFNFYLSHPDINKVLFDTLAARAERRRSEVYATPPPAKADSTKLRDSLKLRDSIRLRNPMKLYDSMKLRNPIKSRAK